MLHFAAPRKWPTGQVAQTFVDAVPLSLRLYPGNYGSMVITKFARRERYLPMPAIMKIEISTRQAAAMPPSTSLGWAWSMPATQRVIHLIGHERGQEFLGGHDPNNAKQPRRSGPNPEVSWCVPHIEVRCPVEARRPPPDTIRAKPWKTNR